MSRAEPMDATRRYLLYTGQTGMDPASRRYRPLTPRQARRDRHKERKGKWGFGYPDTKGYATYPRAEAIRGRLEDRRAAEARRG